MKCFLYAIILSVLIFIQTIPALSQVTPDNWARGGGGTSTDAGAGVAFDSDGNVIVAGSYRQTATFGNVTLPRLDDDDQPNILVAKYDPNGILLWARAAGGFYWDEAKAVMVDFNDDIIITGSFGLTADFGRGIKLEAGANHSGNLFIAKYNSAGDILWAKGFGDQGDEWGFGLARDFDTFYVTGFFENGLNFPNQPLNGFGGRDIFVAKFDNNGNLQWARQAGGSGEDIGSSIAVSDNNNIFVTGHFSGSAQFSPNIIRQSLGGHDVFVAKYDETSNVVWVQSAGGAQNDQGKGIAVFSDFIDGEPADISVFTGFFAGEWRIGNVRYLTGIAAQNVFLVQFDDNGQVLWAAPRKGEVAGQGRGVEIDRRDATTLTGWFTGSVNFDGKRMTSSGAEDLFIARYTSDGDHRMDGLSIIRAGGKEPDRGMSVALFDEGSRLAITGDFKGRAYFDPFACGAPDSARLISTGGSVDAFVARYNPFAGIPNRPKDLKIRALPGPRIAIRATWVDQSDNELGFIIERKIGNMRTYEVFDSVGVDVEQYIDSTVVERERYNYRVRAFNECGNSDYAQTSDVSTGINAPSGCYATSETSNRIRLGWRNNSKVAEGFVIRRSLTGSDDSFQLLDSVAVGEEEFLDTSLFPRQQYHYRIFAYDKRTRSDSCKVSAAAAVLFPNERVAWPVGSEHRLAWSPPSASGLVNIEYSINEGVSWLTVKQRIADTGCLKWLVPNTPAAQSLLRVSDANASGQFIESARFTIGNPAASEPLIASSNIDGASGAVASTEIFIGANTVSIGQFDFKIKFDPNHLAFQGCRKTGLTASWSKLECRQTQPGELVINGAHSTPIPPRSAGAIAAIDFKILASCGGSCQVSHLRLFALEGALKNMKAYHGTFGCPSLCVLGDVNGAGGAVPTPGDALCAFKIALGISDAECDNPCAREAADADCNGSVTPGDALIIFRAALANGSVTCPSAGSDTQSPKGSVQAQSQLNLSPLAKTTTMPGQKIIIPLHLANPTAQALDAFGLKCFYPSALLQYDTVQTAGTLTGDWPLVDDNPTGANEITVGGLNFLGAITASGVLVNLQFTVKTNVTGKDSLKLGNFTDDLAGAATTGGVLEILGTAVEEREEELPLQFALRGNYPNPFNPTTAIRYDLPGSVRVKLTIYNTLGKTIRTLVNSLEPAGFKSVTWDGTNEAHVRVASGVYLCRLEAGDFTATRTLILMK